VRQDEVWVELTAEPLSLERAASWVTRPDCGAVVAFGGTVRDHAQVEPRLAAIAGEARVRWPGVGRLALWHRTGTLAVMECSVVVAASAAHRGDAFDAARFCIDTLKTTVPIWKRERWAGGEDWGQDAHAIMDIGS
jgi:molybdopterin synthase catalytic subunit